MGQNIRDIRKRQAIEQGELARAVGITQTSLWAIEAGRRNPRGRTIRKIAEALGVPVEDITVGPKAEPMD